MKYTIKPAIPAFVEVTSDAFPVSFGAQTQDYVYILGIKPIQNTNPNGIAFEVLPEPVKKQITNHFDTVFGMPIGSRMGYLAQLVPIEVTI